MSSTVKAAGLLLALLAGASQGAYGGTCYQILDRDDSTIYSGTEPPFSMAAPPVNEAQHRLTASGRHLVFFDTSTCPVQTARPVTIAMGPGDKVAQVSGGGSAVDTSAPAISRARAAAAAGEPATPRNRGTRRARADRQ